MFRLEQPDMKIVNKQRLFDIPGIKHKLFSNKI